MGWLWLSLSFLSPPQPVSPCGHSSLVTPRAPVTGSGDWCQPRPIMWQCDTQSASSPARAKFLPPPPSPETQSTRAGGGSGKLPARLIRGQTGKFWCATLPSSAPVSRLSPSASEWRLWYFLCSPGFLYALATCFLLDSLAWPGATAQYRQRQCGRQREEERGSIDWQLRCQRRGWDTDGGRVGDYTCTIHQAGPGWLSGWNPATQRVTADSDICSTHEH